MNNMAAIPPMPVPPGHPSRRQSDYHFSPQPQHPQHFPYPPYNHPQYHTHLPAHQYIPPPYYSPYQHYSPPPPPPHTSRNFQPQSPLVVSSHPHAQPVISASRPSLPRPQSAKTPQPEQSTPSTNSQPVASPSTTATTASVSTPTPPAPAMKQPSVAAPPPAPPPTSNPRKAFQAPLPWLSVPDFSFPPRAPRRRRKRRAATQPLELVATPPSQKVQREDQNQDATLKTPTDEDVNGLEITPAKGNPSNREEKALSNANDPSPQIYPESTSPSHKRTTTKPVVPAIPNIPAKPLTNLTSPPSQSTSALPDSATSKKDSADSVSVKGNDVDGAHGASDSPAPPPPAKAPPKSWAELLRSKTPAGTVNRTALSTASGPTTNDPQAPKAKSLADALRLYDVDNESKVAFLEPRGLVNTANMCYMNSILQILVFCVPFYKFLDQVGKQAVHNFKSDTPLIEAMITFMREFQNIDSAISADQLRLRLRGSELEQYGEPFIPEYVYEVIKRLPRFSTMRRGHQQDAEEFLGFLLEGLHDECVQVMRNSNTQPAASDISTDAPRGNRTTNSDKSNADGGWLEVGPKQKPSVTRSSGTIVTESPITKIFGGKLRSEFRVPGLKNSVTLEPYQPLQLDIGDPSVSNITDAMKNLTRSETIHGNFNSPRGPGTNASKQVFIETLPSVLILHLKRFQYDTSTAGGLGSTQKIWKQVGYPLELEIPREVFPASKRGQLTARSQGLPRYRLIGVVYHHGKNASGGHYTVDVRRQDGHEWMRLDDTVIRRVKSEDVAGEGDEEDPKVLAAALEKHKRQSNASNASARTNGNMYKQFEDDQEEQEDKGEAEGWSQVNGNSTSPIANGNGTGGSRKWSGVVNGTSSGKNLESGTGKSTPRGAPEGTRSASAKENKVAYILFYQQIK